MNFPYFAKRFKFFVVKLKLLRKSSNFLLLGVTNIILVLRFLNNNKFYNVKTVKVVNSKDVSVKGTNFARTMTNFIILL